MHVPTRRAVYDSIRGSFGEAMRKVISVGAVLLIIMGIWHAIHVGRADDVEPYLWVASLFLMVQGVLTLIFVRSLKP